MMAPNPVEFLPAKRGRPREVSREPVTITVLPATRLFLDRLTTRLALASRGKALDALAALDEPRLVLLLGVVA